MRCTVRLFARIARKISRPPALLRHAHTERAAGIAPLEDLDALADGLEDFVVQVRGFEEPF